MKLSINVLIILFFTFSANAQTKDSSAVSPMRTDTNQYIKVSELNDILTNYREAGSAPKVLEAIGAIMLGAGFYLADKEAHDLKSGKIRETSKTPLTLQYAGAGCMTIGFVIDVAAIGQLKIGKQKKKKTNYDFKY